MLRFTLLAALLAAGLQGAGLAQTTVIREVAVFDGDTMQSRRNVLIADGRIADADFQGATPAGARELRCQDCTLLPGLIDAHVHAYQNQKLPLLVGVTSQLDMFMHMHLFTDQEVDDDLIALLRAHQTFVTPTYTVYESVFGRAG